MQAWLPYDVPFAVRAFLAHLEAAIRAADGDRGVAEPRGHMRASAACRCSSSTRACPRGRCAGYRAIRDLTQPMFAALSGVAAQTDADAQRLREAGAARCHGHRQPQVRRAGSTMPRVRAATRLREMFGADGRSWVAASTRDGEEALLLDALARRPLPPGTLTVIVPRHPQRFDEVAAPARSPRHSPSCGAARTRPCRPARASSSATRWASSSRTTPRPTSRSSAEACCRSADRT